MATPDLASLRHLVRDVIRESLAEVRTTAPRVEHVRIANDEDLKAFVDRLADPVQAEAVKAGKIVFKLAQATTPAANGMDAALTGVVNEKILARYPDNTTVTLAQGAVVTPLARDRARARGLTLDRRR